MLNCALTSNLSARALFCLNSLAKVNTHLLIYNSIAPALLINKHVTPSIGNLVNNLLHMPSGKVQAILLSKQKQILLGSLYSVAYLTNSKTIGILVTGCTLL